MVKPIPMAFFRAAALAFATIAFWACAHEHGTPTVKIAQPANGSTVAGPDVLLRVTTTNWSGGHPHISVTEITASEAAEGGHIHVFVDKPIGADADKTYDLSDKDTVTMKGLLPGSHYVIVEGADDNHRPYPGMKDSVQFTVSP